MPKMRDKMVSLYPLTFAPALRDYIWGGRNLESVYGRRLPPGRTAESWEISGHPTASTVVDAGPLRGKSLPDILAVYGVDLVGTRAGWALERNRFPLLIKLLDAEKRLSVQVHPTDEYALAHEDGELGKTEMWYVLHARPGAQLILGLQSGVTPEQFRRAIADNSLNKCLHHLPVKAGDAVFVPSGTLHAILEGVIIAEIQQNSDTTYRVYDWGRLGADGQPRALHVEQALAVTDFQQVEPGPYEPVLVGEKNGVICHRISSSRYFVVEKVVLPEGQTYTSRTDGETLEIWGTVEGESELIWGEKAFSLPTIRFCLVPACLGEFAVQTKKMATMLRVYLP
jgi:mannose-6-phosphate isomerase